MNNDIGQPNNEANNIWKSIGFFNGQSQLAFAFKKTEKITSALYLVSSLIKDNEPIKWELREKGINLLSSAISMNSIEPRDRNNDIHAFFSISFEILALLKVAFVAGIVSEMNHSVLRDEIEAMVSALKTKVFEDAVRAGYVLSDTFFKTESLRTEEAIEKDVQRKPQSNAPQAPIKDMKKDKIEPREARPKIAIKDKKDTRKNIILDLLKRQSNLTIKDFIKAISDCSEKTIQRELLELVAKGIIRKEGKRRWSTYSLK